jgi:Ca-activated chloride channel family protein
MRVVSKSLAICVGLFTAFCAHAQTEPPPQGLDVIRTNTSLVTVPISVMDRQGRFVPNLAQSKFHLFENGVEQEIVFFENAEKPFTVALLLDVSDSAKFKLKQIQDAAVAFVNQLRADDEVMVVVFNKQVTIMCDATNDHHLIESAIRHTRAGGGTSLYTAVEMVATQEISRIRGRKAIVLFTDGVDTTSERATYESTLHAAQELDALVYPIRYNTYDDAMRDSGREMGAGQPATVELRTSKGERLSVAYERADRYLHALADKSGGRFFYAASPNHLVDIFARIAQELREQYSLGYYPKDRDVSVTERAIKIKVDAASVVVRARRTYLYKSAN